MKAPEYQDCDEGPNKSAASEGTDLASRRSQLLSSLKTFIVIISSGLIILVAFSNSLTWQVRKLFWLWINEFKFPRYLQRFWGASGDFWQSQWDKVLYAFDDDKFKLNFYGSFLVTFSAYWIVGLFYTIVDLTKKPAFLLKYKIQDNSPPVIIHWFE